MVRIDAKNNIYTTFNDDIVLQPKIYYGDRSAVYEIKSTDLLILNILQDKQRRFVVNFFSDEPGIIRIKDGDLKRKLEGKSGMYDYELKIRMKNGTINTLITTYDMKNNPHFYVCDTIEYD